MPDPLQSLVTQLRDMRAVDRWAILAKLSLDERRALNSLLKQRAPPTLQRSPRYDFQHYSPAVAKRLAEVLIKKDAPFIGDAALAALKELARTAPGATP